MPTWSQPALIGFLVAALIATSWVAVVQTRAAADARDDLAELSAEVDQLRATVTELETRLAAQPDLLRDLLRGLLGERLGDGVGDGLSGGLNDGLGGLLDGLLDGLLGEADGDGGPLDGLLDGLLGGAAFDLAAPPGTACLVADLGPEDGGGPAARFGGLLRGPTDTPADLDELVATTSRQVAGLRELGWDRDVEVVFLDDAATRARLAELTEPDADALAAFASQQALLSALGAIPADLDLAGVYRTLLGDAVAGFYVSDTQEVVVRVPDSGLPGPADRITLAHELDHALADQVLGLPDLTGPAFDGDDDARRAALAVIEGDATLLMSRWMLEHLSLTEQLGMALDPAITGQQAVVDAFPDVIVRELLFPYTVGLDWACDAWLDGGWAAIDAAHADPPTTTWELLYGEPTGSATTGFPAGILATPSAGHVEGSRTTFGAADLLWQLEAPGGDPGRALDRPVERARAWGGGEAVVWEGDGGSAVGLALRDRAEGGVGLCATMAVWARATFAEAAVATPVGDLTTFDGPRSAAIRCDGDRVAIGLADDVEVAASIVRGAR